jgi:hypothetical protein
LADFYEKKKNNDLEVTFLEKEKEKEVKTAKIHSKTISISFSRYL